MACAILFFGWRPVPSVIVLLQPGSAPPPKGESHVDQATTTQNLEFMHYGKKSGGEKGKVRPEAGREG